MTSTPAGPASPSPELAYPARIPAALLQAPLALALLLIVGGAIGLAAAFELTIDKFELLLHPGFKPSCSWSVLYDCRPNLRSTQGAVFGFPNPLIGLVGFPAPIILGVATLGGVSFPRWFWATFNLGMVFAIGFVAWLMTQSVFVLGTLCPWCMAVWAAVIPMAIATTLFNIGKQALPLGHRTSRAARAALNWTPLITLAAYLAFAVIAQLRLDVIHHI